MHRVLRRAPVAFRRVVALASHLPTTIPTARHIRPLATAAMPDSPKEIYRKDYVKLPYTIATIDLSFNIVTISFCRQF